MPIINRGVRDKRRQRVIELLKRGNSPKQISRRGILGERQIIRIKKKLEGDVAVATS